MTMSYDFPKDDPRMVELHRLWEMVMREFNANVESKKEKR